VLYVPIAEHAMPELWRQGKDGVDEKAAESTQRYLEQEV
jgi:hypothetical protein